MNDTALKIQDAVGLITLMFILMVVVMSASDGGPRITVMLLFTLLLQLVPMSFLNLKDYVNVEGTGIKYPGNIEGKDIFVKISDVVTRIVVTMLIVAYVMRSGCCSSMSNLNPMKMFQM